MCGIEGLSCSAAALRLAAPEPAATDCASRRRSGAALVLLVSLVPRGTMVPQGHQNMGWCMSQDNNGEWWNGGWQRRGKSEWGGEKKSNFRPDDRGSVTLIEPAKGYWVDGEPECEAPINPLANGVFIWTEIKGTGHAFVSVHEDNSPFVFTYGRFGRRGGLLESVGDGILNAFSYEEARGYYREQLYKMEARVFRIDDADPSITKKYFERLWASGEHAKQTPRMGEATKKNGNTVDQYDVTGVNCTTHATKGVKFAGSSVFDGGYTTKELMHIESQEDFAVPVSLQRYLLNKSSDASSMQVVDVTNEFKKQYPNTSGFEPESESNLNIVFQRVGAEIASAVGKVSPYSGGTINGVLEGTFDVNK